MRLAQQAEAREKGEEVPGDEEEGDFEVDATDDDEPQEQRYKTSDRKPSSHDTVGIRCVSRSSVRKGRR